MTSKGEVSPNLDATLAATWRNHLWQKRCVLNLSLLRENKPQKFELFFPLFPAEPYFQDLNVHPFASVYLSFKNFPSKVWEETNTFVFKKVPILTPSTPDLYPKKLLKNELSCKSLSNLLNYSPIFGERCPYTHHHLGQFPTGDEICDQKSRTSQVSNRVSPVTTPNMNECPLTKKGTILWLGYIRDATLPSCDYPP